MASVGLDEQGVPDRRQDRERISARNDPQVGRTSTVEGQRRSADPSHESGDQHGCRGLHSPPHA